MQKIIGKSTHGSHKVRDHAHSQGRVENSIIQYLILILEY